MNESPVAAQSLLLSIKSRGFGIELNPHPQIIRRLVAQGARAPSHPLRRGSQKIPFCHPREQPGIAALPKDASVLGVELPTRTRAGWSTCFKAARDSTSPFPSSWGLAGTPALSTAPSIPARPHSRGSVLPDPGFISRAAALEQQELVHQQWLLLGFFAPDREVGGAFPADGGGSAKHPLRARVAGVQQPRVPAGVSPGPAAPEPSPRTGVSARPGGCSC